MAEDELFSEDDQAPLFDMLPKWFTKEKSHDGKPLMSYEFKFIDFSIEKNMVEKVMMALYDFKRENFKYRKEAMFIVIGWEAFGKLYDECMQTGNPILDLYNMDRIRFRGLPMYRTVDIKDDQVKIG